MTTPIKHLTLRSARLLLGSSFLAVALAGSSPAAASSLSTTTLVTPGLEGHGADDYLNPSSTNGTSEDGRISVFSSGATNLIPHDTNDTHDVFAYDRVTQKIELISHNAAGQSANSASYTPTISGDGRYVAYVTMATDIVPNTQAFCDRVICPNVVVYDRITKTTVFANQTAAGRRITTNLQTIGGDPPTISANGQFVTYQSPTSISTNDTNDNYDIFVYDLQTHTTRIASISNNGHTGLDASYGGSISGDGRFVVFTSYSALVPEDTNNAYDNYLHDMQTGITTLVSVSPSGHPGNESSFNPAVSNDGHSVVFESYASNLVAGDTNHQIDIFLRDLRTSQTRRVSVTSKGKQANGGSYNPALSSDGRFVIFSSWADNLVFGDTNQMYDIFLYDRDSALTRRITRASHNGLPASGGDLGSWQPSSISGDGRAVLFTSDATNLTSTTLTSSAPNLYINYNPVVTVPYYDPEDFLELLP